MRRLARFLFDLLFGLSLLLFVASVILWFRSYRVTDQLTWQNAGGWRQIGTAQGHFEVDFFRADWSQLPAATQPARYEHHEVRPPWNYLLLLASDPGDTWVSWQRGGFAYYHNRNVTKGELAAIAVAPGWAIASATAIIPLSWVAARIGGRLRRRRMQRQGLCLHCGYDLRATPAQSPCPECGQCSPS